MGKEWLYTDIHTHILPGVDDGSSDMRESLHMAELAYREGIRVIIATPHYGRRNPDYNTRHAVAVAKELRTQIGKRHPDMKLFLGNELYYSPGILEEIKAKRALTLGNGTYVLIEFDVLCEYHEIENCVREFVMEGYRPILAHIERYMCLYDDTARVRSLIEQGAYMQVNARGFVMKKKDKRAIWCRSLLRSGLIHFIASDCHGIRERKPIMRTAIKEMVRIAGVRAVNEIVDANILKLIKDEYI